VKLKWEDIDYEKIKMTFYDGSIFFNNICKKKLKLKFRWVSPPVYLLAGQTTCLSPPP